MAEATNNKTILGRVEKNYVRYKHQEVGIKGIITVSWDKKISTKKIGSDLEITTTEKFDKIYLNGKELKEL